MPFMQREVSSAEVSELAVWERDRQIVLAQLHNLMLALRSNTKFSSRLRFVQAAMEPQHRLMQLVKDLRESLFSPQTNALSEREILEPFCEVVLSDETTEPITGVALAAFVAFLELKCSFLDSSSLIRMCQCAGNTKNEITDVQSHEAVLARILQVYVGCARHPAAKDIPEDQLVKLTERAFVISTHGDPSELLRRTAEQAMNDIVTAVFYRIADGALNQAHWSSLEGGSHEVSTGARLIQYICRLIVCDVEMPNSIAATQSAVSVAAVQLQGLCLAHTALFILKDLVRTPQCLSLLRMVRNDLCRALLAIGTRSENVIVLSQLLRTAHLVVQFASVAVIPQALSILKSIHMAPLMEALGMNESRLTLPRRTGGGGGSFSSPTTARDGNGFDDMESRETHEMLMESLLEFCSDRSFATFCFAHFDLSLHYPPLLEQICVLLARNCIHYANGDGGMGVSREQFSAATPVSPIDLQSGETPPTKFSSNASSSNLTTVTSGNNNNITNRSSRLNQINILALDSLMAILSAIADRVSRHAPGEESALHGEEAEAMVRIRRAVNDRLLRKRLLSTFASKFAAEPLKGGIAYLLKGKGCEDSELASTFGLDASTMSGWEVGTFLYQHRSILDKNALGEHLGELGKEPVKPDGEEAVKAWEADREMDHMKAGSVRWHERQLRGFLDGFNFTGKPLLQSIREMVYQMRLPGEAQKIDRVMQCFAEHWCEMNRDSPKTINPFQSEDAAFILSFSIIMLNTDQHSGAIDKSMTVDQFRSMNRGIDKDGASLPDEYLAAIYNDVKAQQIVMIDMVKQGHENDSVWSMELSEARQQATESLFHIGMRGNRTPDLFPFDQYLFQVVWKPILVGLTAVVDGCGNYFSVDRGVATADQLQYHLKQRWAKEFGIFQCALMGLGQLSKIASRFANPEALDQTVMALLLHSPLSLHNGHSNLQMLGRSPKAILALQQVLEIAMKHGESLRDAWRDLATFHHRLYLLGLFSDTLLVESSATSSSATPSKSEPTASSSRPAQADPAPRTTSPQRNDESLEVGNDSGVDDSSSVTDTDDTSVFSAFLRTNPGIVTLRNLRAQAQGGEGGWFSGLWGSTAASEQKKKERELEDIAALRRIKSVVPDVESIVNQTKTLSASTFRLCVLGYTSSECNTTETAAEAFAASYAMHFTLEVVLANLDRIELVEDFVFSYIQSQITRVFSVLQQIQATAKHPSSAPPPSSIRGDAVGGGASAATSRGASLTSQEHWRSVAERMTDAVLRLVAGLAKYPKQHPAMLHLLTAISSLPNDVFRQVVAQPLSVALYRMIVERPSSNSFTTTAAAWNHLLYTAHIVGVAAPYVEVRARMLAVLHAIAKGGAYAVAENSQPLAHALATIAVAPEVTASEVPAEWTTINAFDVMPYVSFQTPLRATKNLDLRQLDRVPEALSLVIHRFVQFSFGSGKDARTPSSKSTESTLLFLFNSLVSLIVASRDARLSSDALLRLQRCLLDPELLALPVQSVFELFRTVVFPLTEAVCLPDGSKERSDTNASPARSTGGSSSGGLSLLSPSVLLTNVFGPMAGPSATSSTTTTTTTTAANTTAVPVNPTPPPTAPALHATTIILHASEEMRCRAVSLLPKAFLHFLYILALTSDTLESTWKRLLGTLYAFYSSNPSSSSALTAAAASGGGGSGSSNGDAGMLRDAIQENVKNVIFVLTATVSVQDHRKLLAACPTFWKTTRDLLKPFDFGDVLIQHIDSKGFQ